jgi:hypothetical protein
MHNKSMPLEKPAADLLSNRIFMDHQKSGWTHDSFQVLIIIITQNQYCYGLCLLFNK